MLQTISYRGMARRGGGVVLHQIFGSWVQHAEKTWTQLDIRFCENEGSNRFKINEKGDIWIENTGENLYKMLKIC